MTKNPEDLEIREDPKQPVGRMSERALWRRCRVTDVPVDRDNEFLDLAGFADRLLDPDEHDRVAAMLAEDPAAAADVAAARALPSLVDTAPSGLDRIIARAIAISPALHHEAGVVVPFDRPPPRLIFRGLVQWSSLAAAIAVAAWFGFAAGSNTSLALNQPSHRGTDNAVVEWFDPAIGFLHDLGADVQS